MGYCYPEMESAQVGKKGLTALLVWNVLSTTCTFFLAIVLLNLITYRLDDRERIGALERRLAVDERQMVVHREELGAVAATAARHEHQLTNLTLAARAGWANAYRLIRAGLFEDAE